MISAEKCCSQRATRDMVNLQTYSARETSPSRKSEDASEKVFVSYICVSFLLIIWFECIVINTLVFSDCVWTLLF